MNDNAQKLEEALKKAIELVDKVEKVKKGEASADQALIDSGDELVDLLGGCEAGPPRRRH